MYVDTVSGKTINLAKFNENDIDLEDIAVSLSRQRRYAGHTVVPWTVTQHSILCSVIASTLGYNEIDIRGSFLHDVEETWIQDVIYPIKSNFMFSDYAQICRQISDVVYDYFDASSCNKENVKFVDELAYIFETVAFRPNTNLDASLTGQEKFVWLTNTIGLKIDKGLIEMTEKEQIEMMMEFLTVFRAERISGKTISSVVVEQEKPKFIL